MPEAAPLAARGFRGLRVVGDVHGEAAALALAAAGAEAAALFVLLLGDLTDHGPDSVGALRGALGLLEAGRGRFLLGNHDHKLRRALAGAAVRVEAAGLGRTLAALAAAPDGESLRARAVLEIGRAPAWLRLGPWMFVHAGWHPRMAAEAPPPDAGAKKPSPLVARALFGEVTGMARTDGYPDRRYGWVDRVPAGMSVHCGHDRRSSDGRPFVQVGALGGRAVFLDLGAGKGGHLGWLDLAF